MDKLTTEFNIGDNVLYRLKPKRFEKENAKWNKTVYRIVGVDGYTYHIRSKNHHVLYKSPNDLKIVDNEPTDAELENNHIYEVEGILDHKKIKNGKYRYQIKWVRTDEPTWEPQNNLRLINKNKCLN